MPQGTKSRLPCCKKPNPLPHDETIGLKFYNILCRTNNDDTRCSEKGLQLQLFYNFCLKADGFRRAKMKGKSAF